MSESPPIDAPHRLAQGQGAETSDDRARRCSPTALIAVTALWIAGPMNWPLWRRLTRIPELSVDDLGVLFIGLGLLIGLAIAVLMSLAAWRATLKPALVTLLIVAAIGAHVMHNYGVVMDPATIVSLADTDTPDIGNLVSLPFLLTLGLLGALPAWLVVRTPLDWTPWPERALTNAACVVAGLALIAVVAFGLFRDLSGTLRSHKSLRYGINPLSGVYSVGRVATASPARRPPPGTPQDALQHAGLAAP